MCPEPDFGLCYHGLIEYYRPSPETSRQQLTEILDRFFAKRFRAEQGGTHLKDGERL